MTSVSIERQQRRSISISIKPDNKILIKAPLYVSQTDIESLLSKKKKWIDKVIEQNEKVHQQYPPKTFKEKEVFLYLGKEYQLRFMKGARKQPPYLTDTDLVYAYKDEPQLEPAFIKKTLYKWYKHMAKEIIVDRVAIYSESFETKPKDIRIKDVRSRWGSCSSLGNLNFSWKLIMAPMDVLDYVVIHELCHLIHQNHSSEFWALVQQHMPDYKTQKKWLKDYGEALNCFS